MLKGIISDFNKDNFGRIRLEGPHPIAQIEENIFIEIKNSCVGKQAENQDDGKEASLIEDILLFGGSLEKFF